MKDRNAPPSFFASKKDGKVRFSNKVTYMTEKRNV